MSSISGVSSGYSGASSVALQSQINKLQAQYADCASCVTTPSGEKQSQEASLSGQIQSLKAELSQVSLDNSPVKLYKPTNAIEHNNNTNQSGQLINISI